MLKTRVITASILFVVIMLALFCLPTTYWAIFTALVMLLGLWEFSRMVRLEGLSLWGYLVASALLAWVTWYYQWHLEAITQGVVLVFWLVIVPGWLYFKWTVRNRCLGAIVGWCMVGPAWFALLDWRPEPQQAWSLLALMGLVWVADVAAYFVGRKFGKHKLAPTISPGKSWEGVFGAVVGVVLYVVLIDYISGFQWIPSIGLLLLMAIVLTAVSIVGDLIESWFKRSAGIKDSSRLLPGHGGVYDRIDSLIAVLAVGNALRILML